MTSRNGPIGIFDSGLGGLTIAEDIRQRLPGEDILFLADQANLPYGEKSQDELSKLTEAAVPLLLAEGAKVVIIACNSASVSIIEQLRDRYPETPFVAVVPMIKPAAERTNSGTVAVFATHATLQSETYQGLKQEHAAEITVIDIPCPEWVGLVESGQFSDRAITKPVNKAIESGADHLVLGCTHYPFLKDKISQLAEGRATVLDSGPAIARQVERILKANDHVSPNQRGSIRHLTSGNPERPSQVASRLTGRPVSFQTVGH